MSEMKAMVLPSGDHWARLSWWREECVRLRVGPFSAGAVNTSPRATKSARSPRGDRPKPSMNFSAARRVGREAPPSVGTRTMMALSDPSRVSSTWSSPLSSYTMRAWSEEGQRTSQVLLKVCCFTWSVAGSAL